MIVRIAIALLGMLSLLVGGPGKMPPPSAIFGDQEPSVQIYREVDGKSLKAYVFSPTRLGSRPSAAVLLFHGGGWVAGNADWTFVAARRFATLGIVAIAIDYRLSNSNTTPIDALADTCAAFRWARAQAHKLGFNPNRIAGYGVSAGGQLVAAAATVGCGVSEGTYKTGGPDALILWSPALDPANDAYFRKLLQGRGQASDYSPLDQVRTKMPPVSIVQGGKDSLTPLSATVRFCEKVTASGGRCQLNVYPGVGHLLTRNLKNQEDDFDPDPASRDDGIAKQNRFLLDLWPPVGR